MLRIVLKRKLLKKAFVVEIMETDIVTVKPSDNLGDVHGLMSTKGKAFACLDNDIL
jgi:predicted transcriptional regulator